jgi:hypothetical protein
VIGEYLLRIKLPLIFSALSGCAWIMAESHWPEMPTAIVFNLVRVILILWAGAIAVENEKSQLWLSAIAGALILAVDHLLVTGIAYVAEGSAIALIGLVASYILFVWIAMLLATLAGRPRKRAFSKHARYGS